MPANQPLEFYELQRVCLEYTIDAMMRGERLGSITGHICRMTASWAEQKRAYEEGKKSLSKATKDRRHRHRR